MTASTGGRATNDRMAGPLAGYRIIEIAGIGPGPFAAMMLADMGAEVIRVERAQAVRGPAPDTPARRRVAARPAQHRHRPEAPRRRRHAARPRRAGRRAHRGLPPGRDGAPRRRPRRVPGPQPEAGVRPDDRLGPGRPVRPGRRPRHQLHLARRCRWRTSVAPGSRPRRRSTWSATSVAAACSWRSVWCARCSRHSAAVRARWSTPRWSTARPC